jgi:hypothetical protein
MKKTSQDQSEQKQEQQQNCVVAHEYFDAYIGSRLFRDVFRQADKNGIYLVRSSSQPENLILLHLSSSLMFFFIDDGKLSLEEFKSYFGDDFVTDEELKKMFSDIDEDHSELVILPPFSSY